MTSWGLQISRPDPIPLQLGTSADKEQLRQHIEQKRHQEKITASSAVTLLRNEILPEHRRQMAELGVMNDAKALAQNNPKVLDFDFEKAKREAAENIRLQKEAEANDFRQALYKLDEGDRYERLIELSAQGHELGQEWTGFMTMFEKTPAYDSQKEYWEACAMKYGLMYRSITAAPTAAL